MSESNKALAARMPLEVFGQGRTEVIDEVVAPDFVDHGELPPGIPPGHEGLKLLVEATRSAFPDLTITIDHAIAEGDFVVQHVINSGTMTGRFRRDAGERQARDMGSGPHRPDRGRQDR